MRDDDSEVYNWDSRQPRDLTLEEVASLLETVPPYLRERIIDYQRELAAEKAAASARKSKRVGSE